MKDDTEKILYLLREWFNEEQQRQYINRNLPEELIESALITVIAGVRRGGKTYLLYQIADQLRKTVPAGNIIYLNLEDDRLYPLTGRELGDLLTVYRQNFKASDSDKVYLLLDEVQNIPEWERTLRRLYDREKNLKIIITGSNTSLLSSEIASSLRGRTLTHTVYPFDYKEFLTARGFHYDIEKLRAGRKKDELLRLMKEYLEYGGFPQAVFEKAKNELLREYYRSIMYRDIIERNSIRNTALFENFLKLTVQNMSARFSFSKTADVLKSIGFKVGKSTLIAYLKYIEQAFLTFDIPVFSYTIKDQLQHPRKIYIIDTGLCNAISLRFSKDTGRLAENMIFIELLRRYGREIYYWKDSLGSEVDFVIRSGFKAACLIQVCWSVQDEKVLKRELGGLLKAMKEFKINSGFILTEDLFEDRKIEGCLVQFRPIWFWLLQEQEGAKTFKVKRSS